MPHDDDIDPALVSVIAGESHSDRRTVIKVLRGEAVRPLARHRIRAVLDARGIVLPPAVAAAHAGEVSR